MSGFYESLEGEGFRFSLLDLSSSFFKLGVAEKQNRPIEIQIQCWVIGIADKIK